ncbi:MAG: phosphatidate cytidylyltransferase [Comamonas sp.]|nr:phosphatidate cytidylyltransferase [Candidatus Comamonas equi]
MLKQRVITALVLLAILLPALFASNTLAFSGIVLLMVTAGAWEWGRLNHLGQAASIATAAVMLIVGLATWQLGGLEQHFHLLWMLCGAFWVLGSAALVKSGVGGWAKIPLPIRWLSGCLALWAAGLAMVQARQIGINFLLSILMLVWVADIFAYFAGRTWGLRFTKVKLAPSISPGKSWEGAWGGALGVLALAFIWVAVDASQQSAIPSFYSRIFQQGWWMLLVAALFMAAMSVVGDLVESLIKRSAGVKDSSQLLPGHGGVLDRIDALLPTLPLAMMLTSMVQ